MRRMKNGLRALGIFGVAVLGAVPALATPTVRTGTIQELHVRADNLHYVLINGTPGGQKPACAPYEYMMVKDENSAAGKSQIAMLMTAYASGKVVTITGAGTCTRWSDGEDISEVVFK